MADTINSEVGFAKGFSKSSLLSIPKRKIKTGVSAYGQQGIVNWWDANRLDTITLNAGRVSRWRDWVGGVDFIQNTAGNQPLYVPSHAGFNGKSSVQADTNARFMNTTLSQRKSQLSGNWFLAFIHDPTAFQTQPGIFGFGRFTVNYTGTDGDPTIRWFSSTNDEIQWGLTSIVSTPSNLDPYIVVITREGKICLNGVITTFPSNFNNRVSQLNSLFRVLGSGTGQAPANYLGHFAELIIGSGEMSDADILRWSDNINANYLIY
jgi:hypothetical protein